MKKLTLAYFGSPDFSADFLEKLLTDEELSEQIKVLFVVTQPDRPVGRKQIISPTPIKQIALKYKEINIITDINSSEPYLKNIDIALVYAYAKIIPNKLLNIPKYGFWCVHPSLLPKYRGTSPMATSLINGDKITGATIIKLDEKIDHGPIIAQESLEIKRDDKRPDLEKKLTDLSFQMFKKIIISNNLDRIKLTPQNDNQTTYTKKLTKQNGFIKLENLKKLTKNEEFYNLFRGLYPWPGIWTILPNKKRLKITNMELGKIKKVQLEGKKEVDFEIFIKGYPGFINLS